MRSLFLTLLFLPALSLAVIDGHKYSFSSEEDAARFEQLAEDLRCPKCQNQNLADSNAPVAVDLRDKVYELMQEGQSDDEIVGYLVDRYGDFVRYRPPFRIDTLLLWGGPVILLVIGLLILAAIRRQQASQPQEGLSEADKARLAELKAQMKKDQN
ncbi:cytochrome c-type biogenesis protein CcmH [Thalassolituus sp.]|jgi:cytochrome c-type biogenesis protein CcmH|uniref:cytochrome c-type biogenesis protein n=1 Tax=Thalassolituus sp. TaxID=2030822 RepID=UPI0026084259|nr:cytochrome c-type biogenesis protein CcmH [uncultured Thalassolituus sp.]